MPVPAPLIKPLERVLTPKLEKYIWKPLGKGAKKIPIVRNIVEFFGQPEEGLRVLKYKALGEIAKHERVADYFSKQIKALPAEKQPEVFEYLTSREKAVPEGALFAKNIKNYIAQLGQGLVDRGILKPGQLEKWKYQYLPGLLIRPLAEDIEKVEFQMYKGGVKMGLRYTKPKTRPDMPEEIFIRDPATLVRYSVLEEGRDIAIYDLLRNISSNPDWVYQPSMVSYKGIRYTVKDLQEKLDQGFFPKKEHKTIKRLIERGEKQLSTIPKGFTQIPDHKAYGSLRGLVVRNDIARDILPAFKITDTLHASKFAESLLEAMQEATRLIKVVKVPLNPPTIMRNVTSNVVQLNMSGMNLLEIPVFMGRAAIELAQKGKLWKEAFERGVTRTSFSAAEIAETRKLAEKLLTARGGFFKFYSQLNDAIKTLTLPYGKIDEFFKLAKFIHGVEVMKWDYDRAMLEAHKWIMDYASVPALIRRLRMSPIGAPFITYTYRILPLLAETAVTRPWVLLKYAALPYAMIRAGIELKEWTEDEAKEALRLLPEYYKRGNIMVLPWKNKEGKIVFVPYLYHVPWGNIQEAGYCILHGHPVEALRNLPTPVLTAPLVTLAEGVKTGRDPYTGREFVKPYATAKERLVETLLWVTNQTLPPFTATPYGSIPEALRTLKGLKGHPVAKLFGVNIKETDIETLRKSLKRREKFLESEINRDIGKAKNDFRRGQITREEMLRVIGELRERRRELRRSMLSTERPERPLWKEIYLPKAEGE